MPRIIEEGFEKTLDCGAENGYNKGQGVACCKAGSVEDVFVAQLDRALAS